MWIWLPCGSCGFYGFVASVDHPAHGTYHENMFLLNGMFWDDLQKFSSSPTSKQWQMWIIAPSGVQN